MEHVVGILRLCIYADGIEVDVLFVFLFHFRIA